jgi:YVTN family beta-propeller protein
MFEIKCASKAYYLLLCTLSCFLYSFNSYSQQKNSYQVSNTFHIASPGSWDYLAVEPGSNKLFVSHGTQVNIIDKNSGDSIGIIENTTGVHGIAFIKELNKGFTSNGRLNNVTVFDLATDKQTSQISTGQNPDAILYEPFSKKIITCNGRSNDLTVIDPVTEKVVATIAVVGKPETAVSNDQGLLFVNVEDKNEIVEIDTKSFTVLHHWPIAPGEAPTGLALDKQTNRLFAGCEKMLIVLDATNGKVVANLPIGDGCDGVAFDTATKNIFTSNGEGNMTVIHENTPNDYKVLETITTKPGARTITLDEQTHTLYLPTSEFEKQDRKDAKARRKMIPGSFQVLVMKSK